MDKKPGNGMKTLRLILNDQLSTTLASLRHINIENDIVMLCETKEEATYVKHHKQKLIFSFSAMRHFANELRAKKIKVHYISIDDPDNSGTLDEELKKAISLFQPQTIELTFPGEYRLLSKFLNWQNNLNVPVTILEDDRFFCSINTFKEWANNKKQFRMENFYEVMRKKHHILLQKNGKPIGGRWNYDTENRKPLKQAIELPVRPQNQPDNITKDVIELVNHLFKDHFGDSHSFNWAVTREHALQCLHHFIDKILPQFGDYQDAMHDQEPFLFHSLLSPYLNSGLLSPFEVCKLAEEAYHDKKAPLNAVEGFIRQILGWREYMRGIYWLTMPNYAERNFFTAKRKLPGFYWTADTNMNCLRSVVQQTKENAYSHHIQRLMITGNFALITGLDPNAVCEWYLSVYIDAYAWVELPNTLGMSLFGDGGLLGSKPYAASGKYIKKMSNFCEHCIYNPNENATKTACPFNSLYWDFMQRNEKLLRKNLRLTFSYAVWDKMAVEKKRAIIQHAHAFLEELDASTY